MGDKGSLPLVAFLNSDIVVSPSYVKLGEDLGIFKFVNEVRNQGEGVCISDSMTVEVSVILARSEASILFFNEEERGSLGEFGQMNFPRAKVLIDELIYSLSFLD